MKCDFKGCSEEATCMPKVNVPAMGWPIDMHQPLSFVIGLTLCDKHFASARIGDFLHDGLGTGKSTKEIFRIMARGKIPPDFDQAFLSKCGLNSEEARMLLKKPSL